MEYMCEPPNSSPATGGVLCCECGTLIEPNPSNMCVGCLTVRVDLSEGIPKQNTLYFCRGCDRYLSPPNEWVNCSLESRELLSLCLKKLKGLNRVKLVDAGFVWTEPHSKRIKVKLVIQGEVIGGTILQQTFIIDYIVNHQMCLDCHRVEAKDFWKAVVQIRQKALNKKTFYYLEQLILKHRAHENSLGIKPIHEGLDFYYATEAHARKLVDFLSTVLPCRYQHSKKLLSHDVHSNTYNYKFTFSVEIVPISKDSLVCLSKRMAQQLGGINPLCIVLRVTNNIHLIDPTTAQLCEVSSTAYWRDSFNSIFNPKQLVEYIVMDIEFLKDEEKNVFPGQGPISYKHAVSDVWLVKASELGINDNPIHTRSHLGNILKPGDSVLGYNLAECNVNDTNFEKLSKDLSYDVFLVKKHYGDGRSKKRAWKLKRLDRDDDMSMTSSANRDYNEFLDDLEEDPLYRQNINIYRDWTKNIPVDTDDNGPKVSLDEMLDDMHIGDE